MEMFEKNTLSHLIALFQLLTSTTPKSLRCKHVWLFLEVAQTQGLTLSELSERIAPYSLAATVKLVHELTAQSWRKDPKDAHGARRLPGVDLLMLQHDPRDHRVKRVYLSEKGVQLLHQILRQQQETLR